MGRPVKVTLLGRAFTVQSDDDEAHVQKCAALVDGRVADLKSRVGAQPDLTLTLLAALTLADDLEKERARHLALRKQLKARADKLRDRLRGV
jgi:cell division protein ZapA